MSARNFLHLVNEAATALICAGTVGCGEPGFCRDEAAQFIAKANGALTGGIEVIVHGVGSGRVEAVTADARLVVRVGGVSHTVAVCDVAAR